MWLGSGPVPAGGQLTAIQHPSPNHGARRDGAAPSLIVIHYTAMTSAAAALERLCDPEFEVSAHYLIGIDGTLWQMVPEDRRAWHAGAGSWLGQGDVNSHSIGIELDNQGTHPFPEPQMAVLEQLLADLQTRWQISPQNVIGHSDMAPGRKSDPGVRFDWPRLECQGLASAPTATSQPTDTSLNSFRRLAAQAGYPADVTDTDLLQAVRLRLRPGATGPLSSRDLQALAPSASFFS